MRLHAIAFKTLQDLFSIRRSLIFLVLAAIVPVIAAQAFSQGGFEGGITSFTLGMQNQMITGLFIIICFVWTAGIPAVLLASVTCGDFISKEDQDGTLLLLVSKPIRRWEIMTGKFMAFMANAVLLQAATVLITVAALIMAIQPDAFIIGNVLALVPSIFLYSMFVSFVFGAIGTALSSILKSRIKTIMLLVALTMLVFFGFMMARGWMQAADIYESFVILDVNYHLGNSYLYFLGPGGMKIMPMFQGIIGQFTGTYDAADMSKLFDADTGAMPPHLEPIAYYTPLESTLIWTVLAVGIFILGALMFEKKEIR